MHLFRPAVRRLVSLPRYTRPHHLLSRPHLHHHQQPISSLLPLRLCSNSATTDGLRNNRDLAQSQASLSSHDATLLSQLSHTPEGREDVPAYAMVFTCKACGERSAHRVSKQAYHHGTVLITCPGCKKRHLMADHLKVCLKGIRYRNQAVELS
jgi:hypothetical protein